MRSSLKFFALIAIFWLGAGTVLASAALDPGEVAKQKVTLRTQIDKFQGKEYWAPKPKMLAGAGLFTTLYTNPVFTKQSGISGYYFFIEYQGFGWLYLSGKVIFLLDDGSTVVLEDPTTKVASEVASCSGMGGCLVTEIIRLTIMPADMQRIAKAKSVEVAIYGRDKYATGYFKPYHQAAVIEVLKFGDANGGPKP